MANRYWVGGAGTWNTTSTTNWSASSGGASGASVPTAADSVFFDQAGTYTVTCTGALTCLDITVSAGTVTIATGTSPTFAISGSMSLIAGTVWSSGGAITFNATTTGKTVTTNGVSIAAGITFNGIGGDWTLGSALTITSTLTVTAGAFSTNNFNVTAFSLSSSNSNTRTINLGSSTVTLSSGSSASNSAIYFSTNTGLTFNAGTSTIVCSTTAGTPAIVGGAVNGAGVTFNNVSNTGTTAGLTLSVTGINTFNNFSVTGPSTPGVQTVSFDSKQTINGILSTTGTAGSSRVFFSSATYGISVDLVVNAAPSLTDADFRGLYVRGTAAPISGTRIGNRGECRGITFSTPKTVYWSVAGTNSWSGSNWSNSSGGATNLIYYPLPQDTAIFNNSSTNVSPINVDTTVSYLPTIDWSARTTAATFNIAVTISIYGNWTSGSGLTISGTSTLTFAGGTTQTITSAGKAFSCPITVDTYGGTVQLADALDIGTRPLTVTNGTFNTQGYAVSVSSLSSSYSTVRAIILGASTLSFSSSLNFFTSTNLTFNAGTSLLQAVGTSMTFNGGGLVFYNVSFTNNAFSTHTITGANTYNNLTFTSPVPAGVMGATFSASQTINGTLNCSGASAVNRLFLRSDTAGTPRTLTVNSLSANDCDFRDITITGAAAGSSPTRAGNCGGNSGITFPSPKTVYWNLAGAQNWSATGWAASSGGAPAVNNFPMAQDTAVFDNTGSVTGTITINAAWNIGTFDASARTSAMSLSAGSTTSVVYGDWKFGTGVTALSSAGTIAFAKNGTSTITSNGVQFSCFVSTINPLVTVRLADAFSLISTSTLILTYGTFDAVTYNVTLGALDCTNALGLAVVKMGSGTWTITGTGSVWSIVSPNTLIAGTANIVLSDTSTTARTFAGGSFYYNKLTIGGATGTSTLTIQGANTFSELASTKTVAHTITFQSFVTQTIGKWSVTGTAGNVVTLAPLSAASAYTLVIAGPANSGIDYLSVSYCAVSTTSPGEFYVGANSTNTAGNTGPIFFTATPAPRTLYWVGGTGNWSSTTKWSTSSGGASGAAIPTSLDAVNFDSLSNATAYTATIDAGLTAIAKCASFTMAGPATGNVTFAGTVGIAFHGNVSFAATGITRTYTGAMQWAGNSSYTFTTNGQTLGSACTVIGIGATWSLGSAITTASITATYGTFSTSASNYSITSGGQFSSSNSNVRTVNLNSSTLTLSAESFSAFNYGTITNLTFNAGASQINLSGSNTGLSSGGLTFNNVSFTGATGAAAVITGANTFNALSFAGQTTAGIVTVTFNANQTIGTLTLNAGTAAAYRKFVASDTLGTQRTLTVTTLTAGAADYDFRDIAVTGAAAPLTGTRFGDCKGNSGITFDAAKTVYYVNAVGGTTWGSNVWSNVNTSGTNNPIYFPLAQDTAVFPSTLPPSGTTTTINANYNIGTIDMSARTANTMTLATGATTPAIYGNWINGTGTTLTGTGNMTFAGRGSQTITSAGKTFTQTITVYSPGGSVTLQDAFVANQNISTVLTITQGTFDAGTYNVTLSGAIAGVSSSGTLTRTIAVGSGTWTISGTTNAWFASTSTNLTITGTGTINLNGASAKTFTGGGISYSGITLDNGGAGALTISGNNTFKNITNTYSATGAATISLGSTTTTLTQFTGTGAAAKILTLSGATPTSPAILILTSGTVSTPDYLSISNVKAYSLSSTWYAGANSTNLGSLGWIFASAGGVVYSATIAETGTGTDSIFASIRFNRSISETASATDLIYGKQAFRTLIAETGTGTDSILARIRYNRSVIETASASDLVYGIQAFRTLISEAATGSDLVRSNPTFRSQTTDTASGTDSIAAKLTAKVVVNESATITDLVSAFKTYLAQVLESASGVDSARAQVAFVASVTNLATAQDVISAHASFATRLNELASGVDVVAALGVFPAMLEEAASGSVLASALQAFNTQLSEGASIADAANTANSVFGAFIAQTATASDSLSAKASFRSSVSNSASITDYAFGNHVAFALVVDSASIVDVDLAKAVFAVSIEDFGVVTDNLTAPGSIYNPTVLASALAIDAPFANATFNSAVFDFSTAFDSFIGAYLWNPIDDTQVPNWQNINNIQVSGWGQIDDSQTASWQNVNNTQASGWNEVDDSQDPNWVSIQQNP